MSGEAKMWSETEQVASFCLSLCLPSCSPELSPTPVGGSTISDFHLQLVVLCLPDRASCTRNSTGTPPTQKQLLNPGSYHHLFW